MRKGSECLLQDSSVLRRCGEPWLSLKFLCQDAEFDMVLIKLIGSLGPKVLSEGFLGLLQ